MVSQNKQCGGHGSPLKLKGATNSPGNPIAVR